MLDEIRLGLPRPKNDEPLTDFNAIRRAIEQGARDSSLIHNCLRQAQYEGLSGEDKYTLLAYHALLALETYWQQTLSITRMMPAPGVVSGKPIV